MQIGAEYATPYLGRMNDRMGDGQVWNGTQFVITLAVMLTEIEALLDSNQHIELK